MTTASKAARIFGLLHVDVLGEDPVQVLLVLHELLLAIDHALHSPHHGRLVELMAYGGRLKLYEVRTSAGVLQQDFIELSVVMHFVFIEI